ncbi:hypothetical protein ACE1TF_10330 [Geomicrobium sp. JSM 1781026]|uniref:hypothetical protein n=1 Tax=unclassified Geomicrobium TaxID=2628951 RepID=UPI00045F3708|nr:hypothetical protein [Geomicrobium sp. JCM 19039]GAK13338.1 hypothetical protein JCM19039_3179 [Geomicrobium sp. JCM 19039]
MKQTPIYWITGMLLAMLLLYVPIHYISTVHQERALEASIFEESNWQYYTYQYLGTGTRYTSGNPTFYLAHNGAGYFVIHVAQNDRQVERITPISTDQEQLLEIVDRYEIQR